MLYNDGTFIQFATARCRRPVGQLLSSGKRGEGFVDPIGPLLLLQYSVHCLLLNLLHVIHL